MTNQDAFGGSVADLTTSLRSRIETLNNKIIRGEARAVQDEISVMHKQITPVIKNDDTELAAVFFDADYQLFNALLWMGDYQYALDTIENIQPIADEIDSPIRKVQAGLAQTRVKFMLGLYESAHVYLEPALELARKSGFHKELAECLLEEARYKQITRYMNEVLPLQLEAVRAAKDSGDEHVYADCLYSLGRTYINERKVDLADKTYKEALEIYKRTGNQRGVGRIFRQIMKLIPEDQPETRREFLDKAISIAKKNKDVVELAMAYSEAGWELLETDSEASMDFFNKEMHIYQSISDKAGIRDCINRMAAYYSYYQMYSESREFYERSMEIDTELEDFFSLSDSSLYIGFTYFSENEYEEALKYFELSLQQYMVMGKGSKNDLADRSLWIARTCGLLNRISQAEEYFQFAIVGYTKIENWAGLADTYYFMAKLYRSRGDLKNASDYLFKSIDELNKTDQVDELYRSYEELVSIGRAEKNYDFAIKILDVLIKMTQQLDNKELLAQYYMDRADVHYDKSAYKDAIQDYVRSLNLYIELGDEKSMAFLYWNLGQAAFQEDLNDDAIDFYKESMLLAKKHLMQDLIRDNYCGMGDTYYSMNEFDRAAENYTGAVVGYSNEEVNEILSEERRIENKAWYLKMLGSSYSYAENPLAAAQAYEESLEEYQKLESTEELAKINKSLAYIYSTFSDKEMLEKAVLHYQNVLKYFGEQKNFERTIWAQIYHEMAKLFYRLGNPERSRMSIRIAIMEYEKAGDKVGLAKAKILLDQIS